MARERKGRKLKKGTTVRRTKCATCVFRDPKDGGCELSEDRRIEIQTYLIKGTNHLCHTEDNTQVCRGGREFQLQCWHRMGLIEEPTDAALRKAMQEHGFQPGAHV